MSDEEGWKPNRNKPLLELDEKINEIELGGGGSNKK